MNAIRLQDVLLVRRHLLSLAVLSYNVTGKQIVYHALQVRIHISKL